VITSVDHTAEVASLVERIERLHRVRKAVVLAYNQQLSEVQTSATPPGSRGRRPPPMPR
jgi:quinolinate synthase